MSVSPGLYWLQLGVIQLNASRSSAPERLAVVLLCPLRDLCLTVDTASPAEVVSLHCMNANTRLESRLEL
jgi:hypothetical protein